MPKLRNILARSILWLFGGVLVLGFFGFCVVVFGWKAAALMVSALVALSVLILWCMKHAD